MEESTPRADPAALLAQHSWVRRVARALVRDGARSDDLEQSVWLRALERPREVRSPRAWLGTALRNAASDLFRGEGRRRRREEAAARTEAAPAADEAVARAEALRRAVDAALALHEPYRTVVVLRFFEDLAPPAIAERLGVPLETVRTRLRRALEILRTRLDDDHGGDRRAWLALLLPLAGRGPFPGLPAAPAASAERGAWSGADAAFRAADATFREVAVMTAKAAFAAGVGTAFAAGALLWLAAGIVAEEGGPTPPSRAPAPGFPAAAGPSPPAVGDPRLREQTFFDSQGQEHTFWVGGEPITNDRLKVSGEIMGAKWPTPPNSAEWEAATEAGRAEQLRRLAAAQEDLRARLVALQGRTPNLPEPLGTARLEGVVLEQDGTPVRGRVVVIAERAADGDTGSNAAAAIQGMTAVVRPDGSFVVRGLDESPFRLKVWGEDYLQDSPAGPHRAGDRVEIRVVRGAALVGRVADLAEGDHGRFLLYSSQDGKHRGFATIAPDGAFQFRALRPGTVRVEAAPAGEPGRRVLLGEFTAPAMEIEVRLADVKREAGSGR